MRHKSAVARRGDATPTSEPPKRSGAGFGSRSWATSSFLGSPAPASEPVFFGTMDSANGDALTAGSGAGVGAGAGGGGGGGSPGLRSAQTFSGPFASGRPLPEAPGSASNTPASASKAGGKSVRILEPTGSDVDFGIPSGAASEHSTPVRRGPSSQPQPPDFPPVGFMGHPHGDDEYEEVVPFDPSQSFRQSPPGHQTPAVMTSPSGAGAAPPLVRPELRSPSGNPPPGVARGGLGEGPGMSNIGGVTRAGLVPPRAPVDTGSGAYQPPTPSSSSIASKPKPEVVAPRQGPATPSGSAPGPSLNRLPSPSRPQAKPQPKARPISSKLSGASSEPPAASLPGRTKAKSPSPPSHQDPFGYPEDTGPRVTRKIVLEDSDEEDD